MECGRVEVLNFRPRTTPRRPRSRMRREKLVGLGMAPSSQGLEPPGNPARFEDLMKQFGGEAFQEFTQVTTDRLAELARDS